MVARKILQLKRDLSSKVKEKFLRCASQTGDCLFISLCAICVCVVLGECVGVGCWLLCVLCGQLVSEHEGDAPATLHPLTREQ